MNQAGRAKSAINLLATTTAPTTARAQVPISAAAVQVGQANTAASAIVSSTRRVHRVPQMTAADGAMSLPHVCPAMRTIQLTKKNAKAGSSTTV